MVGRLGFAHLAVRQHFSPVKSRDFTAAQMAVRQDRDTKADPVVAGRRRQLFETLPAPGNRVALNGQSGG